MPITHAKSNIIGDWNGTVTLGNSTGGTTTAAASDLVRPSDWNSGHVVNLSAFELTPVLNVGAGLTSTTAAGGTPPIPPAPDPTDIGLGSGYGKHRKREKLINRAQFVHQQEADAITRAAQKLAADSISIVPRETPDVLEDDELILMALTRILH